MGYNWLTDRSQKIDVNGIYFLEVPRNRSLV